MLVLEEDTGDLDRAARDWWEQMPEWNRFKGGLRGSEEIEYRTSYEELWMGQGVFGFAKVREIMMFLPRQVFKKFQILFLKWPPALRHLRTAPVHVCDLPGMEH